MHSNHPIKSFMRKISASVFFIFLLLSISCTDHLPQTLKSPVINTGILLTTNQPDPVDVYFSLFFSDLGEIDILEYGIIYGNNIPDSELIVGNPAVGFVLFTGKPIIGDVSQVKVLPKLVDPFHYKAYAKLGNGSVIYGKLETNIHK